MIVKTCGPSFPTLLVREVLLERRLQEEAEREAAVRNMIHNSGEPQHSQHSQHYNTAHCLQDLKRPDGSQMKTSTGSSKVH